MSFVERKLSAQIDLVDGVFAGGGNSKLIENLRMTAKIQNYGGASMGQLELAIYGLPLSVMNQLTTLGTQINLINKNSVTLMAGSQKAVIFKGTIATAWADGAAMPMVPFRVSAFAGLFEAVQKTEPTSVDGSADVADLMGQIAKKAGLQFENNGVSVKIASPYLPGSPRDQIKSLAIAAGVAWSIDRGTLAIWKPGDVRQGYDVKVSRNTGLVGYPAFNQSGIVVTTLFNPNLRPGGKITVESDITPACGDWSIYSIDLDLASQVPRGPWFAMVAASRILSGAIP